VRERRRRRVGYRSINWQRHTHTHTHDAGPCRNLLSSLCAGWLAVPCFGLFIVVGREINGLHACMCVCVCVCVDKVTMCISLEWPESLSKSLTSTISHKSQPTEFKSCFCCCCWPRPMLSNHREYFIYLSRFCCTNKLHTETSDAGSSSKKKLQANNSE